MLWQDSTGKTNILRGFKARNGGDNAVPQSPCKKTILLSKFMGDLVGLIDSSCNATPSRVSQGWVALAVQPEVRVVLPLNEPEPALVSIFTPRLHRKRLVEIVILPLSLVGFLYDGLYGF